jgi:hypothetical protein
VSTHPFQRFQSDFRKRFPEQAGKSLSLPVNAETLKEPEAAEQGLLKELPPEIGVLLLVIGTAGILLPGPVGSPFLVAGGIALWPAGFRNVERWFMKLAPKMYKTGVGQIERFLADLESRYPGSVR